MGKAFWILVCFNLLFLVFSFMFYRDNIKTDLNQMNDNLNETSIQNALKMGANSSAENTSCTYPKTFSADLPNGPKPLGKC